MSAPALQLQGLGKAFPARRTLLETLRHPRTKSAVQALDGLTCDIEDGEFFGLLGENGAGKTTLFRILSTLVAPDSGSALILGTDVLRDPRRVRSLVAPVFTSDRSLYWRLSARENLRLFAALQRLPRTESEARIREVLAVVGLSDTAGRMVGTFSTGMRQRLLLARALLARPRVLLLDEPTRSLDPIAARSFRAFLRQEIGSVAGCTVVLATHDPDDVRDLCDRVGILHRGRLVALGTSNELSAGLGVSRYRLTAGELSADLVSQLRLSGIETGAVNPGEEPGWFEYQLELPLGIAAAAQALRLLSRGGIEVARFERIELPLADLIERVIRVSESPHG